MRYFAPMIVLAGLLAGCATASPSPSVDITGRWSGSWEGYGIFGIKRDDVASARFQQQEGGVGSGRLWLDGTLASESVPLSLRLAGLDGVPLFFDVNGDKVIVRHQKGGEPLAAFIVAGDTMIGRPLNTDQVAQLVLKRVVAPAAIAPLPPAPALPVSVAEPARPAVAEPVVASPARLPAPSEFTPIDPLKAVAFDFDRADIRPSEAGVLEGNVRWLQANRDVLVLIEGHCDERGSEAYNLALGERRARAVHNHLVSQGVAADRLATLSYGEQRPVCTEPNESCWARNRRADFIAKPK